MDDLAQIEQFLTEGGYFSTRQRMTDGGERLMCVSRRDGDGRLHGNSFWITRRAAHWLIATWTPHVYTFPEQASVLQVAECCIDCLTRSISPLVSVPDDVVARYGLLEQIESTD